MKRGDAIVIYAPMTDADISVPLHPRVRYDEICDCKSVTVRKEKYLVWELLKRVVTEYVNLDFDNLQFTKTENGQWICPEFCFSLSHSHGLLCVAVSDSPIGVDAELVRPIKDGLGERILTDSELHYKSALSPDDANIYLLECWVKKESIFKREGGKALMPRTIEVGDHKTVLRRVTLDRDEYLICVSCIDTDKIEFKYMEEI